MRLNSLRRSKRMRPSNTDALRPQACGESGSPLPPTTIERRGHRVEHIVAIGVGHRNAVRMRADGGSTVKSFTLPPANTMRTSSTRLSLVMVDT